MPPSASPCHLELAFMMCFMSGCSRSSRARHLMLLLLYHHCTMALWLLNLNTQCASDWRVVSTKSSSSGRASQQHLLHGRTSSCSAPSTRNFSSRTSCPSTRGEISWSGAHTPGTVGPVMCVATQSALSAQRARAWARRAHRLGPRLVAWIGSRDILLFAVEISFYFSS